MATFAIYKSTTNPNDYTVNIAGKSLSGYTQIGYTSGSASELQNKIPELQTQNQTGDTQINDLYQRYFGRNANSEELSFWKTQPITGLENQLLNDYKTASGLTNYDGSPMQPGGQQTTNQISSSSPAPTQTETQTGYVYGNDVLGSKANNAAVNTLYQAYFGRNATQAELGNWGEGGGTDTTVQALEDFLKTERTKYGVTTPIKTLAEITGAAQAEEPGENDTTTPGGEPSNDILALSQRMASLPQEIVNSPEFNSLSQDQQSMLLMQWMAMRAQDEETRAQAQEALAQAQEIADPISKIQIAFVMDSIPDQFKITKMGIQGQLETAKERIAEITTLMGEASIEEQRTLEAIRRDYDAKAVNIEEQMADAGLTYSSKRSDAEKYLAMQNMDMREATQTGFAKQARNYEQNKRELQRQEQLTREAGEAQLKAIAAGAEGKLGSDMGGLSLEGLSGQKIGSVTAGLKTDAGEDINYKGSIEEQRRASIVDLSSKIQNLSGSSQLKKLFNL